MTFAERLKQLRKENGMTLEEVGNIIGVGRANIYKYEHGIITNVPPDKVHQLANLFGVTRPYIMGWTEKRNVSPDENLDMVAEKLRQHSDGTVSVRNAWKPAKTSDCTTAATQALRALAKFKISRTPIYPQQVLQASSVATIITFDNPKEMSLKDDEIVVSSMHKNPDGIVHHIFAVNRNAPIGELSLLLSIHIGHIYLGHVGEQHDCKRRHESECFAVHFRYPRPVVKLLMDKGFVFTRESISRIFGYCDPCLDSMLKAQPVATSPELNRLVKEQFAPYINSLEEMGLLAVKPSKDEKVIDLSRYMEGYED